MPFSTPSTRARRTLLTLPTRMTVRRHLGKSEFEQVHARIESAAFTPPMPQP
ncbi:MAG: hypothetical protein Q4G71_10330 [Pseudomonadota bacterium]|nr:hypothetical protein [Pseudomonadota bacterium]